jgi:hypothetical protein
MDKVASQMRRAVAGKRYTGNQKEQSAKEPDRYGVESRAWSWTGLGREGVLNKRSSFAVHVAGGSAAAL